MTQRNVNDDVVRHLYEATAGLVRGLTRSLVCIANDPHMQHVISLPVGNVMHSTALFPNAQWSDHVFYREFWSAYKVRELIAAKVAEGVRYVRQLTLIDIIERRFVCG
jgi:hypothetical protein